MNISILNWRELSRETWERYMDQTKPRRFPPSIILLGLVLHPSFSTVAWGSTSLHVCWLGQLSCLRPGRPITLISALCRPIRDSLGSCHYFRRRNLYIDDMLLYFPALAPTSVEWLFQCQYCNHLYFAFLLSMTPLLQLHE